MQSTPGKKAGPEISYKNIDVAKRGGRVASNARKETKKELNRSVVK